MRILNNLLIYFYLNKKKFFLLIMLTTKSCLISKSQKKRIMNMKFTYLLKYLIQNQSSEVILKNRKNVDISDYNKKNIT